MPHTPEHRLEQLLEKHGVATPGEPTPAPTAVAERPRDNLDALIEKHVSGAPGTVPTPPAPEPSAPSIPTPDAGGEGSPFARAVGLKDPVGAAGRGVLAGLGRAGNLIARLATQGIEVPGVTPALRRGTDEVFQVLDAFAESTFRTATSQDPVNTTGTLNPAEIINQGSAAFRERPLAAQLGIGAIDPGLFIARVPGAAGRVTSAVRVGDVPIGPRTTEAVRELAPSEIPPSLRPDVRRTAPVSDEELLFASGERNRLGPQVAEAPVAEQRARLDAIDQQAQRAAAQSATELRKGIEETIPNITGVLKPMTPEVEATVAKLTGLIDEARPLQREAIRVGREARSQELSSRVGRATALEQRLRAQGVSAQEASQRSEALLRGEQPAPVFDPLQIEPNEINPLFEHISDLNVQYFSKINTRVALEKVLAGALPSRSELELLRQVFGRPLVDALRGKRPLSAKAGEIALDIFNAPRQILTAYDVSAPLRQGVVLLPSHPGRWAESVVTMFKALAREGVAQADDATRRADPNWLRFTARHPEGSSKNLFIADLSRGARGLSGQEEQFMSRLASLIPGIRQSQRAYVTFLNKLRYDVMTDIVAKWERVGIRPTNNDLDELALFLNRATGRGSLGPLNDFAPVLNTAFFAPRLLASRVQLPFSVASSSALVRKQAATDLSAFIGTGLVVLSLASLAGASVELDPRSSDFGKIRMGNTSLDFWGGFQSLARYASQFALGESKIIAGRRRGDIRPVPGIDTLVRFLRSKLSPTAGLVADVTAFQGEDFLGNPILGDDETSRGDALKAQAFNRLVPLFEQDLIEAFNDDGITGLFKAAPAGLGAGAVTFERGERDARPQRRRLR